MRKPLVDYEIARPAHAAPTTPLYSFLQNFSRTRLLSQTIAVSGPPTVFPRAFEYPLLVVSTDSVVRSNSKNLRSDDASHRRLQNEPPRSPQNTDCSSKTTRNSSGSRFDHESLAVYLFRAPCDMRRPIS